MLKQYQTVRPVARRIADAIDKSVAALRERRVQQEPAMTDRMLGRIEEAISGFEVNGIRWAATTLTDRGTHSEESRYGADFMGVLNIDLPEFSVSKGFLAQAKLVRTKRIDPTALKQQCERMLNLSPDSFVFIYSMGGVRVVPAVAVVGCRGSIRGLYSRSAERFFEEHLECFIGDRAICSPSPGTLRTLQSRYEVRSSILLQATLDGVREENVD